VSQVQYADDPATPGAVIPNPALYPDDYTVVSTGFVPNQEIARFSYDFTDMKRLDLEAGARHYFNPIVKSQGFKTVTPFVVSISNPMQMGPQLTISTPSQARPILSIFMTANGFRLVS